MEGCTPREIATFFNDPVPAAPASNGEDSGGGVAADSTATYKVMTVAQAEKFIKMKKILPDPTMVQQKMELEGRTKEEIALVLGPPMSQEELADALEKLALALGRLLPAAAGGASGPSAPATPKQTKKVCTVSTTGTKSAFCCNLSPIIHRALSITHFPDLQSRA